MKNETEFDALVARMMGETKRMQFKCEGLKAMHKEVEITITDLLTLHPYVLEYSQRWRVTHAIRWSRYPLGEEFSGKAVIEIWGIYSN